MIQRWSGEITLPITHVPARVVPILLSTVISHLYGDPEGDSVRFDRGHNCRDAPQPPGYLTKRAMKSRAVWATSCHPWSMVREWPRFGISTISVVEVFALCRL
jgi:hypothetical protein